MAEFDEISASIGGLRQANDDAAASRARLEQKIDRLADAVSSVRQDLEKFKNRGYGVLVGVSLASSFVGAKISTLIKIFPAIAVALFSRALH